MTVKLSWATLIKIRTGTQTTKREHHHQHKWYVNVLAWYFMHVLYKFLAAFLVIPKKKQKRRQQKIKRKMKNFSAWSLNFCKKFQHTWYFITFSNRLITTSHEHFILRIMLFYAVYPIVAATTFVSVCMSLCQQQ